MNVPRDSVVIVGGDPAGLVAAVHLARAGVRAILFQDAIELRAGTSTDCRAACHVTAGSQGLYERGAAISGLRALNVPIDGAPRGPNGGLVICDGVTHTLPVGCLSLLTTGVLALSGKREMGRFLAGLPTMDVTGLQGVPLSEWIHTELHDPGVRRLALALARCATCSDEPDHLSAAAALDQLRLGLIGPVFYTREGAGTIVGALADAALSSGVTMATGQAVVRVNMEGSRASTVTLRDGTLISCRAVIVATGPRDAERLLGERMPSLRAMTPVCVAALDVALRRLPSRRAIFAMGVDDPTCFSATSSTTGLEPPCGAVVHVAKYLRGGVPGTADDERLLDRTLDLLQPGWRGEVVHRRFLNRVVVSHALVSAEAGGLAGRPGMSIPGVDNVFLAGDWVGPTGQFVDASVASGMRAARAVERLTPSEWQADAAN